MRAIFVGLRSSDIQRAKAAIKKGLVTIRTGWSVTFLPNSAKTLGLTTRDVRKIADKAAGLSDVHVLAFSTQDKELRRIAQDCLRPFFRFLWLPNRLILSLIADLDRFSDEINRTLGIEEEWAAQVRPTSVASPLLLPSCTFGCSGVSRLLWEHAESYGAIENVRSAVRTIEKFESSYRSRRSTGWRWLDDRELTFDHCGARHGRAPVPFGWKYSFQMPEGFHYDVSSERGHAFSAIDRTGQKHSVVAHGNLNVDPHGRVRG